jgi:hypothetical protein
VSAVAAAEKMADAMVDASIIEELKTAFDSRLAFITAEEITMAAMMVEALYHLTREQWWISSFLHFSMWAFALVIASGHYVLVCIFVRRRIATAVGDDCGASLLCGSQSNDWRHPNLPYLT